MMVEAFTDFREASILKVTAIRVGLVVGVERYFQIVKPFHIFFQGIRQFGFTIKDEERDIEVFHRQA